tara:strand:+ start:2402 stop:3388 length:987 start_codon:yes stop_codon:yes gene_type:complete
MAYIDDERRRRAGVELTPDQEAWLAAAMEAQAKGLPIPPRPTEMSGVRNPGDSDYVTPVGNERPMANQGQRVLSPAYTDPRSQAIAQTPAMIRPAHSMLDRLFRPGRADTANQMNREYKENALRGQVAESSSRADLALKELELRARKGDPDALAGLEEYYKVEALRRGGGGVTPWGQITGANVDKHGGSAKPKVEEGAEAVERGPMLSGQLTLSEAREKATSGIAERKRKLEMLDAEEVNINTEGATRSVPTYATGGGMGGAPYQTGMKDMPINMIWRARRTKEIPAERAAMQQEIQQLEQVLTEISGPLTSPVSPDKGGATYSNPNQ